MSLLNEREDWSGSIWLIDLHGKWHLEHLIVSAASLSSLMLLQSRGCENISVGESCEL